MARSKSPPGIENLFTLRTRAPAYFAFLLELVRLYWCIENGTHYRLDVSAGEDQCRVGDPVSITVFGILRRAVQGEHRAWARGQPCKRDRTFPTFRDKMSRRLNQVIRLAAGPIPRL